MVFEDSLFEECYFEDITSSNTFFKNCTFIATLFYNTGRTRTNKETAEDKRLQHRFDFSSQGHEVYTRSSLLISFTMSYDCAPPLFLFKPVILKEFLINNFLWSRVTGTVSLWKTTRNSLLSSRIMLIKRRHRSLWVDSVSSKWCTKGLLSQLQTFVMMNYLPPPTCHHSLDWLVLHVMQRSRRTAVSPSNPDRMLHYFSLKTAAPALILNSAIDFLPLWNDTSQWQLYMFTVRFRFSDFHKIDICAWRLLAEKPRLPSPRTLPLALLGAS